MYVGKSKQTNSIHHPSIHASIDESEFVSPNEVDFGQILSEPTIEGRE